MMQLLLIALLSALAQFILPWWSLAIIAFLVCFWRSSGAGSAFLYGFAGIALTWLGYALIIHTRTDGVLTGTMGELLFKRNNVVLPLLVTTVAGGLVGGLAGLSGFYTRQAVRIQTTDRIS